MVRTQVYFTPEQHKRLHKEADALKVSLTEYLRRVLDQHFATGGRYTAVNKGDVMRFVGLGESGISDTSEQHLDAVLDAISARR